MGRAIRILVILVVAVVIGDFVLAVSQNIGAGVWLARGLGAVTAGIVGGAGYFLVLVRGRRSALRAGR